MNATQAQLVGARRSWLGNAGSEADDSARLRGAALRQAIPDRFRAAAASAFLHLH